MCLFQFWFPQCVCPAVGLLGHMAVLFPVFKGISTLFSVVAVLVCIPTNSGSLFSTPSPAFIVCRLFDSSHSDQHEMAPHCGFGLHFSDNEWYWASFHVFVSHLWEKCLFSSLLAFNSNSQDKIGYTAIKTNKQTNKKFPVAFHTKTLSVKQNKPQVQVTFQANHPPAGAWFIKANS